jgi:hypothetical protein
VNRPLRIAVCVALCALPACFRATSTTGVTKSGSPAAQQKGVREATESVAAGVLKLKEYPPLPAPAQHGEYIKLLQEKGIGYEVMSLPTGVADADFRAEIQGWNEVMQAEIQKKLGPTFLADLREEANKRWEEKVKGRK